jgi:hypothetical protein
VLFPLFAVAVRRVGLRCVQQRLARTPRRRGPRGDAATALDTARRVSWVTEVAAERGPWPANCLQRSLVLWWLLRLRGIDSELRIGVRRSPGARSGGTATLEFHAWIEHRGVVLNEVPDIRRRFATFDRAIAPSDARFR